MNAFASDHILLSGVESGDGFVTITKLMETVPEPGSLTLLAFGAGWSALHCCFD